MSPLVKSFGFQHGAADVHGGGGIDLNPYKDVTTEEYFSRSGSHLYVNQ